MDQGEAINIGFLKYLVENLNENIHKFLKNFTAIFEVDFEIFYHQISCVTILLLHDILHNADYGMFVSIYITSMVYIYTNTFLFQPNFTKLFWSNTQPARLLIIIFVLISISEIIRVTLWIGSGEIAINTYAVKIQLNKMHKQ